MPSSTALPDESGLEGSPSSLGSRAAAAAKWSSLGEIISRVATPISYLILAKFLTPSDFGVVTAAVLVVALSEVLATTGFARALVQREAPDSEIDQLSNAVFWPMFAIATATFLAVLVIADFAPVVFADSRVVAVVRVQAIQIPIAALAAVPHARYERALDFKPLFKSRLVATLVPAFVALGGVVLGLGYWALVVGLLAGASGRAAILWAGTDWRPGRHFEWQAVREMLPLAIWLTAEALLIWAFGWSDTIVVGAALNTEALGLYRFASVVAVTTFAALLSPMQPVLFSALSRLQSDSTAQIDAFRAAARLMALVALPAGVAFLLLAERLVTLVLPPQWAAGGQILAFLGITYGISWIVGAYDSQYRAMGRPDLSAKIMASALPVYLVAYYFAASAGIEQLLWARLTLAILAVVLHVAVADRVLDYGLMETAANLWRVVVVALAVAAAMLGASVLLQGHRAWPRLIGEAFAGLVTLGATAWCLERPLITRVAKLVRTSPN